jgi:hypothetical protein
VINPSTHGDSVDRFAYDYSVVCLRPRQTRPFKTKRALMTASIAGRTRYRVPTTSGTGLHRI